MRKQFLSGTVAALACVAALSTAPASAQPITALSTTNSIFTFDSATPGTTSAPIPVTGLAAGDELLAIDRDPNGGALYGISRTRAYRIDEATGAATQPAAPFTLPLGGEPELVGMDFDPTSPGVMRITTSENQNLLYDVTTGTQQVKTNLFYPASSNDPNVAGLAYDNNSPGAGTTTLYGYDYQYERVVRLPTPDTGELQTVGPSGVSTTFVAGLDVAPDGTLFGLLWDGVTRLYTVNKSTGAATPVGQVGGADQVTRDIATAAEVRFEERAYSVGESDRQFTVYVERSDTSTAAEVEVVATPISATENYDYYEFAYSKVTFEPGQKLSGALVRVHSDALLEGAETFRISVVDGPGSPDAFDSATVRIVDDESAPPPSTPLTLLTLTPPNALATIDSANPRVAPAPPEAITGLPSGEELIAIDRRPATGRLYGISKQSRLFVIDEGSGAATQVGGTFTPSLAGGAYGFDFDPATDTARITSYDGENLRVDPSNGSVVPESPLVFESGDMFAGQTPRLVALAYSNNVPGATSSTPFGYDYGHDALARIESTSSGSTATVGYSGLSLGGVATLGMDIAPDGTAFALALENEFVEQRLHVVNLETGDLALVDRTANGFAGNFRDLAAPAVANTIELESDAVAVAEAAGTAVVRVVRSQTRGAASVAYATSDGSAVAGQDYTATGGTVTFAAGEASKDVAIPVSQDAGSERTETLTFALSSPAGGLASIGGRSTATLAIADDDMSITPPPPPPPALVAASCTKRKQRILKQKAVVACVKANGASTARARGTLKVKGFRKAFKLKAASGSLTADRRRSLRLKLPARARSALARARGKATAKLTIVVGGTLRLTTTVRGR